MAEWEHMERDWNKNEYSDLNGNRLENSSSTRFGRIRSFTEWLDWQCTDGWEVFKISRNFNSNMDDTWCVFRRLV